MDREDYQNNRRRSTNQYRNGRSERDWDQLYNDLGDEIADAGDEAAFLDEVNRSLAQQVNTELGGNTTSMRRPVKKKKRLKKGVKRFAIVFSVIMVLLGFLMFTSAGRSIVLKIAGNYIYNKLDYDDSNEDEQDANKPEKPENEKHVVNILLLGVEEIEGASNTDVIIVASMNTVEKTLKLTSLMRDLYVEIPGYNNNKLNSVYAKGGIDLLYEVIDLNFGIKMDGYALVNFGSFEDIVDILGGVEVTLTSNEAYYLNHTNYISDPANRTVKEGTQTMNGNQALGYVRVRYVSTSTESNDFGRTQRQRAVLNAIFEKVKSKNIIQLGLQMNEILSKVPIATDISQKDFNSYLEEALSLRVGELENYRIPSDGNFKNEKVQIGSLKQAVLVPIDWDATRLEIKEFIYGNLPETDTAETDTTESLEPVVAE
ncbi:MAG: cell envelope-related transcriptional attenuator [Anaerocolumna sp.]|jgi:LCP family protein required for cell wall assembly|nr:cell envelope-related transcriptional attenuator [Anaerocolumna sp.]